MKKTIIPTAIPLLFFLISCSSPQPATTTDNMEVTDASVTKDSVAYYDTEFEARQKNYMSMLTGSWGLASMQRQARLPQENLDNFTIHLNQDMTFSGTGNCGTVSGNYTIKGTSIKFSNVAGGSVSKAGCNADQINEMVRLLMHTVSAYTVTDKSLLLRDGSSNVIFTASR